MKRSLLLLLLFSLPAFAHDPNGDPLVNDWLMKQRSVGGFWCCDGNDVVYPEEWGAGSGGYWFVINGAKISVPKLIDGQNGQNPTHRAVVWLYPQGTENLRCFAPGTLS